ALGRRPIDRFGRSIVLPNQLDSDIVRTLLQHPRVTDDQQARGIVQTTIGQDAGALLGPDARVVAEHQAQQRQPRRNLPHHAMLRSVKRLMSRTRTKVITSIVIASTAIGPQSLLSRRSNMVTETVLVRAVNNRIVADSSRMEPIKIRIQVVITPLRISGTVMSTSARARLAPKMRLASSNSGCTALSDAPIC